MKLHGNINSNGKRRNKGAEMPKVMIYPFFLVHMLMFGVSGFLMAYSDEGPGLWFLYLHGGIAITVYCAFYLAIFGVDRVKWMFINAGFGLLGIYTQIGWILAFFAKDPADYPVAVHAIPFLYYVLYTFLLHQMVLDLTGARAQQHKRDRVDVCYVLGSVGVYGLTYFIGL